MRRSSTLPLMVAAVGLVFCIAAVPILLLGSMRYGGPQGLFERARHEVTRRQERPHPEFVPTPLPVAAVASAVPAATELAAAPSSPVPTAPNTSAPAAAHTPAPTEPAAAGAVDEHQLWLPAAAGGVPGQANALPSPARLAIAERTDSTGGDGGSGARIQRPAATLAPAVTPTLVPTASPTGTPAYRMAAPSVYLKGVTHAWQGWNNCGPTTLAMNLSYFGSRVNQNDVGAALRPNKDDKNVSPEEMAAYARGQGYPAVVRANGDADRLRLLLSNDVPVLLETWLEPEPNDGMGHYRLIVGYDDAARQWRLYDSYVSTGVDPKKAYEGIRISYADMDAAWAVFNRTYLVIYTEKQAAVVEAILGADMDDAAMWARSLERADSDVLSNPKDPFARFNRGTSLVALGRHAEAAAAFDEARQLGLPWRMLWYQFGPFIAYHETGRQAEVLALADATLRSAANTIEEIYYWRAQALRANGDIAGARAALERALVLNRNHQRTSDALLALPRTDR